MTERPRLNQRAALAAGRARVTVETRGNGRATVARVMVDGAPVVDWMRWPRARFHAAEAEARCALEAMGAPDPDAAAEAALDEVGAPNALLILAAACRAIWGPPGG